MSREARYDGDGNNPLVNRKHARLRLVLGGAAGAGFLLTALVGVLLIVFSKLWSPEWWVGVSLVALGDFLVGISIALSVWLIHRAITRRRETLEPSDPDGAT